MIISTSTYEQLRAYLRTHESDIANEVNDFGYLREAFAELFERAPVGYIKEQP